MIALNQSGDSNLRDEILISGYDSSTAIFWIDVVFIIFAGLFATAGNGLVLYAAHGNKNIGPLRYLDNIIKSLAVADMLFGLIGTPLIIFAYYIGTYFSYFTHKFSILFDP